jgi:hypothetical protein
MTIAGTVRPRLAQLVVRCPSTAAPIQTGLDTDSEALRLAWDTTLRLRCPHCGREHAFKVRDAYIEAEIAGFGLGHTRGMKPPR